MRDDFVVDGAQGERWELALQLLSEGGTAVRCSNVVLRRDTVGPWADGRIHVGILSACGPGSLTGQMARLDVRAGQAIMESLRMADPRLDELLDACGATWEYVYDYSNGAVTLAALGDDGELTWGPAWAPSS